MSKRGKLKRLIRRETRKQLREAEVVTFEFSKVEAESKGTLALVFKGEDSRVDVSREQLELAKAQINDMLPFRAVNRVRTNRRGNVVAILDSAATVRDLKKLSQDRIELPR